MKKNKVLASSLAVAVLRANWKNLLDLCMQSISNWMSSALKKPSLATTSGSSHEALSGGSDFSSKRTGRQVKRKNRDKGKD